MAATSRRSNGSVLRSLSPSERFYGYRSSSPSAFSFSTRSAASFFCRSTSPPRVKLHGSSPARSAPVSCSGARNQALLKRTCMCSPTTHPGSFRCGLHKGMVSQTHAPPYASNRLNARRSAMTNSLVRIGGVEGDLVRRALAALIRPSSHQQRRRVGFKPRRSRLSIMSNSEEIL